jgi:hypothetical protein
LGQAVHLSLGGSLVQIEGGFPLTLHHVPWAVNIECDIEPV